MAAHALPTRHGIVKTQVLVALLAHRKRTSVCIGGHHG